MGLVDNGQDKLARWNNLFLYPECVLGTLGSEEEERWRLKWCRQDKVTAIDLVLAGWVGLLSISASFILSVNTS